MVPFVWTHGQPAILAAGPLNKPRVPLKITLSNKQICIREGSMIGEKRGDLSLFDQAFQGAPIMQGNAGSGDLQYIFIL